MTIVIATGPLAAATAPTSADTPAPAPTPTFTRIVIEGDSITSTTPYQADNHSGFYSHTWADEHPALTSFVSAQGSRVVGGAAYNGDLAIFPTNSLIQQVANDLANDPDLLTAMIGVNDLYSTGCQTPTYLQRLRDWAALIRAGGVKLAYAPPTPVEVLATVDQASRDRYMAKWDALWTTYDIRNPAVWGEWADYYIPLGEHPFFLTPGFTSDGVHPSGPVSDIAKGQFYLKQSYDAAMATLLDTSRINAAGPYESVWDAFGPFDDLAPGVPITRRVVLSGLAWAGRPEDVAVTGGDATVEVGGKTAPGCSYNGDVVDFTLTPSASYETSTPIQLTIGGETRTLTFTTAENLVPVAYVHGDIVGTGGDVPATTRTLAGVTLAAGKPIVTAYASAGISSVTVGGVAAVRRIQQLHTGTRFLELWEAPEQAGGAKDVVVTYSGSNSRRVVGYGTIVGGQFLSAVPMAAAPVSQANPHLTPTMTVPANGLALALFNENGGATITPATCNSPTTLVDESSVVYQSGTYGFVIGEQTASAPASFSFAHGMFARCAVVYKAV